MTEYPVPRQNVAGNYGGREDAIFSMKCLDEPMGCGRQITQEEFISWDDLSRKEYTMSGFCKTCQDKIFNPPDGCTCNNLPCCEADVGVGIIYCNHPEEQCPIHGKETVAGSDVDPKEPER